MRFFLLGPLRVEHQGAELDLGGGKPHLVLASLVLARSNVVPTDRLVELIWGGSPPAKPYVTVRSYISYLRRALEPDRRPGDRARLLVTRSPGYALDVDQDAIDVFRFEREVGEAAELFRHERHGRVVETVTAALDLWRSSDLSDSPLAGFVGEVERLVELNREAVALRTDALLELGRHHQVIPDLSKLVETESHRERPRAQLMLALHRAGRSAEAIEVYQTGLRSAIEDRGLELSPALGELERRILSNDPGLGWTGLRTELLSAATVAADEPPPPIGRDDEVARARRAMLPPSGGLIALSGEPGIGKSHLIDHLAHLARVDGALVLAGQGHREAEAPLGPWRSALLDLIELVDDDTLGQLVGSRAAELGRLLPELLDRLGLAGHDSHDPHTLYDTIAKVIERFAASRPLFVCLDDLHWADPATVRLASFVASSARSQPVTILAAWRDTELVDDELSAALAELGALAGDTRFELAGLGPADVRDLWSQLGGGDPERHDIDALHRRTGGNPLFITELLRSSPETAPTTPTVTVQDAIATRIGALPEACRTVLNIAALCPGGFSEDLLRELSGLDEEELLNCLEALLQARILVEDPRSIAQFTFSHSVIGESLAVKMSGGRKARLHTRIAEALQRQQVPIGKLAHHYLQGVAVGEPVVAATSALEAARTSAALHDHRGAIDLIERGLTALGRGDDDLLRAELLVELAQQKKYLEHFAQTHSSAQEAFRLAKRAGDLELMVRAAFVFCGQGIDEERQGLQWLGYWNPPGPALDMLADCLEKLPAGGLRALVLLAYAGQLFGEHHDPERAKAALDEAVTEARSAGTSRPLAAVLHYRLATLQRVLDLEERRSLADETLTIARANGFGSTEVAALRDLLVVALDEGHPDGADARVADALAVARQHDDPTTSMMVEAMPISLAMYSGQFDRAEAALGEAMQRYERVGSAALDLFGIQWAALARERGNQAEVESVLAWKLSGYPGPAYAVALAAVMADQGKLDEAGRVLAEYGDSSLLTGGEGILQYSTPAFYAGLLVDLGDVERARELYPALRGAAGRVVTLIGGLVLYGSGSLYLGSLATLIGHHDEAAAHLDEADRHHRSVGARPYELRTILARADLAAARGLVGEVDERLSEAKSMASELTMDWLIESAVRRLQA